MVDQHPPAPERTTLHLETASGTEDGMDWVEIGGVRHLLFDGIIGLWVDGESLAEEGIVEFLEEEVVPLVSAVGVPLRADAASTPEDELYQVEINDEIVTIGPWAASPWYEATMRPLARVNELLDSAGRPERFFVLQAGGNDGLALFTTPEGASWWEASFAEVPEVPTSRA